MGRELLDYDPDTCVSHYTETVGDKITLQYEVDATAIVEANKVHRNQGHYDEGTKNKELYKYCDLDDVLIMKMLNKGINILRPSESDWKKFFREIETNYPYYKVTNKKAWRPK